MNENYVIVMTQNLDSFEQSLVLDLDDTQEDEFCYRGYFTNKNSDNKIVLPEFNKGEKEYLGILIYKQKNTKYWMPVRELKIIDFQKIKKCKKECSNLFLKNRGDRSNIYKKCINPNKDLGKEMKRFIVIPWRYIYFKSQNFKEFCEQNFDKFLKQFSVWPIKKESYKKLLDAMQNYAKKINPSNPKEIFEIGEPNNKEIRNKIKEEINNFTQKIAIIFKNIKKDYSRCIVRTFQEAEVGNFLNKELNIGFEKSETFFKGGFFSEHASFTQNFKLQKIFPQVKKAYDYDFVVKKNKEIIFVDCTLALFFKNPISIPSFKTFGDLKKHINKCYEHWNLTNNIAIKKIEKLFPKYNIHFIWLVDEEKIKNIVDGLVKRKGAEWIYPLISWNKKKYKIMDQKNMHLARNIGEFKKIVQKIL